MYCAKSRGHVIEVTYYGHVSAVLSLRKKFSKY